MPDRRARTSPPAALLGAVLAGLVAASCGSTGPPVAAPFEHRPVALSVDGLLREAGGENRVLGAPTPYCLGCHGGSPEGALAGELAAPSPAHSLGDEERNHPVDVAYPAGGDYVPGEALDRRISLAAGRLTCLSCHDPGAADHRLVISTSDGELCRACHVL